MHIDGIKQTLGINEVLTIEIKISAMEDGKVEHTNTSTKEICDC
jgi:hypothetical protein